MKYTWETKSVQVKRDRLAELSRLYYQTPELMTDVVSVKEEMEALHTAISDDLVKLGMEPATASPTAVAIASIPQELPIERRKELVNYVRTYIDEMLPSTSGRVAGEIIGLVGVFMASGVSALLLAIPETATIKGLQLGGKAALKYLPKGFARLYKTKGPVGELARKIVERVPIVANAVAQEARPTKSQIAFWCVLGAVEDAGASVNNLLDVWRRKVEPPKRLNADAEKHALALGDFVDAIGSGEVFDDGSGKFKDYIESNGPQYSYTLSLDELLYDFFFLDCARRHLRRVNRGVENQHYEHLHEHVAALIQMMIINKVDEIALGPGSPLFGWWVGLPQQVVTALTDLSVASLATREAMHDLGFTDSETFQSTATMIAQNGTRVGLTALERIVAPKGFFAFLGRFASSSAVKKIAPAAWRIEDLSN